MDRENPFSFAASQGALNREVDAEGQKTTENRWDAHLEACRIILVNTAEARLLLAQQAMNEWGHACEVKPVFRIETMTGAVLFRTSLHVTGHDYLELTVSPKRQVITALAHSNHRKKRWGNVAITAQGISSHIDTVIKEFIEWWR